MGYSPLTRYNLFMESGDLIAKDDFMVCYKDYLTVKNMYYDSAHLIMHFEDIINDGGNLAFRDDYLNIFENNAKGVDNKSFVQIIKNQIQRQFDKYKGKSQSANAFKIFFRNLVNAIGHYQENVIESNFMEVVGDKVACKSRKQTFLSYAYYDKGLTLALFYYFWKQSGFLYVNWMWDGVNKNGCITKTKLEDALQNSNQLLFLRTVNSELRLPGNYLIRQWCAWEIGNFYTKHNGEKYYTCFYDKFEPHNDLLDTFQPMREVVHGEII